MWFDGSLCFCWVIINVIVQSVYSIHHIDNCSLLPSELGPDWYKVPQPVPPSNNGKPAYEPNFIHMPCAQTTVFDIGVCGCTNLMSFIFTSVNRKKRIHNTINSRSKVDPRDIVKRVEPSTTPRPLAASLLINTRTGEVKECPFRASSRGPMWYLIREPRDNWRHMKCAAGTLFEKTSCTCVHKLVDSRDPEKPEDANIIIIEDDFRGFASDNTISQSLGISVSDIDFSANQRAEEIPYWRRTDIHNSKVKKQKKKPKVKKSDVRVILHDHGNITGQAVEDPTSLGIGKDQISDAHKSLFLRGSRGGLPSHSRTKISPLVLDSNVQNEPHRDNNGHSNGAHDSLIIRTKPVKKKKQNTESLRKVAVDPDNILNVLNEISTKIDALKDADKVIDPDKRHGTAASSVNGPFNEKYHAKEQCQKEPLETLGPQYFLLHVRGLGNIPFTCHGNTVYDHSLCACKPAIADTAYDEVKFPVKDCTKRALPALGPQFFLEHLIGVGYIPYVCHGQRIYDHNLCACI
ncbi:uncharacterized protein LOC132746596 [Ruditapes philippinarum]|uniref:uncharacterized protein LOC132746596 n=1 Tax=Ruditapes philippinarum TaxID=129788 RepID=UPI00295ACD2C|nr:uncharacterized protein LOC132746596 [Ruditapes philippinarum]XP_060591782.1 uncharacterized protein LOC132746596 [Ruditapes philippinarum]XP_060591783.1 uncharacterized protein LOC132746596 [Ruditapes philippinarum]XP_060591784.1 uncharacterized protein LOC132746596 [Ruditapes philippinarum]